MAPIPYAPGSDVAESFLAPNGATVTALVKGPAGATNATECPSASCYVSPPMTASGYATADAYFPAAVNSALSQPGINKLVIPYGVYDFTGPQMCNLTGADAVACTAPTACNVNQYWNCAPHWQIDGVRDLEIDLSGSVLNFSAPVIGIAITNSKRVKLVNFTIDWPNLPISSLGTIVADPANPGHNAVTLDQNAPLATDPSYAISGMPQIQAVNLWNGNSGASPQGAFDASAGNNLASDEVYFVFGNAANMPVYIGNGTYSCGTCSFATPENPSNPSECSFFSGCANLDYFPPGARVVVRHFLYNGMAIYAAGSDDIDLEAITIYTSPGLGIAADSAYGHRGLRVANTLITRAPNRPVSTASDAINLSQLQGDIILSGVNVAYAGDDGVNIAASSQTVTAANTVGSNAASVAIPGTCGPDPTAGIPLVGDFLAFFDGNADFLFKARVRSCNDAGGQATLGFACATAVCQNALAAVSQLVDMTQQAAARYVIENSSVQSNRGRCMVLSAPFGLVSNDTCTNNSVASVVLTTAAGTGFGPANLTVTQSQFTAPGSSSQYLGAISALPISGWHAKPVFQKILVSHSTISATPGPAIVMAKTRGILLQNNTILDSNQQSIDADFGYGLLQNSIILYQNYIGSICGTAFGGSYGNVDIQASTNFSVTNTCS